MFAALRTAITDAATAPVGSGGMGFPEASRVLYDELPASLPALCVGPAALGQVARAKAKGARSVAGVATLGVLVATDHAAGDAASDAAGAAMLAALYALGFSLVQYAQTEDDWAGRAVFTVSAQFAAPVTQDF